MSCNQKTFIISAIGATCLVIVGVLGFVVPSLVKMILSAPQK